MRAWHLLSILIFVSCCFGTIITTWQFPSYGEITCIISTKDTVVFGTSIGLVVFVDSLNGTVRQTINTTLPIGTCVRDNNNFYFGSNSDPANITKIEDDYSVSSIALSNSNETYLISSTYYNGYLYFGTNTSTARLIQIKTSTFTRNNSFGWTDPKFSYLSSLLVFNDRIVCGFKTSTGVVSMYSTTANNFTHYDHGDDNLFWSSGVFFSGYSWYYGLSSKVVGVRLPNYDIIDSYTGTVSDVTAVVLSKNGTMFYASRDAVIVSRWFNDERVISTGTGTILCGSSYQDFVYFGGTDNTGDGRVTQMYVGDTCIFDDTCDCVFSASGTSHTFQHNTTNDVYYYPDLTYCGNCSNALTEITCENGVLTLFDGTVANASQIHVAFCNPNCLDCYTNISGQIHTIQHNVTEYWYSASEFCGECANTIVPVYCYNGQIGGEGSTIFSNCTSLNCTCNSTYYSVPYGSSIPVYKYSCGNCSVQGAVACSSSGQLSGNTQYMYTSCAASCDRNCTITAGNMSILLTHNSSVPTYSQSTYCGNCSDIESMVYCSPTGQLIGNYSSPTCTSICENVVLVDAKNVTLKDTVVIQFPQAANYTATYSVADRSNDLYKDPTVESFGSFLGTSFFITFYKNKMITHIPPPGTFVEISTNITENAFLYYFDTDSSQWTRNCNDPIIIKNILRVELCHATQYAIFQLTFDSPSSAKPLDITIIVIIVIVLVVVIGGLAAGLVYYRKKIKREKNYRESVLEMSTFSNMVKDVKVLNRLGGGNFGEVYRGEWKGTEVALKKLKSSATEEFVKESQMLSQMSHPHIVQFIGIYINESNEQFIVTEFMKKGDLLSLLRNDKNIPLETLCTMAKQAAAGMVYLEDRNIVHRDLALRNFLVASSDDKSFTVKVSDFGLSRTLSENEYYTSESSQLPVKWSAPESLKFGKFSSKSDVWSFGVCLWEMFSRGEMPYFSMTNSEAIEKITKEGYRLPQPLESSQDIYKLMLSCWHEDPEERPSFAAILATIEKLHGPKETSVVELKESQNTEQIYN